LYLWGQSTDTHIGGVSFDILSSSNALTFNSSVLTSPVAGTNWNFPGLTPTITNGGLTVGSFNGGASAPAVGFGATTAFPDLLLGSVAYTLGLVALLPICRSRLASMRLLILTVTIHPVVLALDPPPVPRWSAPLAASALQVPSRLLQFPNRPRWLSSASV